MYDTDLNAASAAAANATSSLTVLRTRQRGRPQQRPKIRARTHALLADLVRVLELERLERDLFRGVSRDIGTAQALGGQVIAQALGAASKPVEERTVHSLHAYFLRRGDLTAPIIYQVARARDGSSFSSRRVSATQHGEEILHMAVSFQRLEEGFEHQFGMPDVAPPEGLPSAQALATDDSLPMPERLKKVLAREKPFEFRFADPLHFMPTVVRSARSTCGAVPSVGFPVIRVYTSVFSPTSPTIICSQRQYGRTDWTWVTRQRLRSAWTTLCGFIARHELTNGCSTRSTVRALQAPAGSRAPAFSRATDD